MTAGAGQGFITAARRTKMTESEIIFAVEESPDGGYQARALGHSIYTQADTLDELKGVLRDALRCHFDEGDQPKVIRLSSGQG
jgi:hypothetical protein